MDNELIIACYFGYLRDPRCYYNIRFYDDICMIFNDIGIKNHIDAKEKIALDINTDVRKVAFSNVKAIIAPVKELHSKFKEKSVDVFFMSNLLEHLDSKEDVFRLLSEAFKALRSGGRLLIMQPDIGLVGNAYWDFFD